jgi:hypothetical protein
VKVALVPAGARAAEAVAAIDGLVTARYERHASHTAARITTRLVHLAGSAVVVASAAAARRITSAGGTTATVTAAALAGGPAFGATSGGIGKAARGIKLLLADCERKLLTTVAAGKGLLSVHDYILSMCAHGATLWGL